MIVRNLRSLFIYRQSRKYFHSLNLYAKSLTYANPQVHDIFEQLFTKLTLQEASRPFLKTF